ncbi:MAG: CCA tRNA nucleotidyltransferase [Geobacter sp.]|nr:MAG: CCA tRNA nucleotidyltransferase [Geobacter sp.]
MEEGTFTTLLERDDIRQLVRLAADCRVNLYLVGGGVRDLLLGRPSQDLDFATEGECVELPHRFAATVGGTFFWLDEERRHGRVVRGRGGRQASYDFVLLQGDTIEDDLALRDFTINALAFFLNAPARGLLDPLGGAVDLSARIIRSCSPSAFADDPVRLVRAIRFAATLKFGVAPPTWDQMLTTAPLLEQVAAERVRDEFFKILAVSESASFLRQLSEAGLLHRITGQGSGCCTFVEGFDRVARLERLAAELSARFPIDHERLTLQLAVGVEDGISSSSLLKLAALVGPVAADGIDALSGKLRLGNRSRRMLRLLCQPRLPVGLLIPPERQTTRTMYRFFRDEAPAGLELVLLSLSDGVIPLDVALRFVEYYCHDYDSEGGDLYLSCADIMTLLDTAPGPLVGKAAALLREAESRGMVNSTGEAEEFLRKKLLTNRAPIG